MDAIYHEIKYDVDIKKYFNDKKICFLDIETTGFNRNEDIVYLVGLLSYTNDCYILKQYLISSIEEESILLKSLTNDLQNFEYIITYNGDSFDIPFLNSKYNKYNIFYEIPKSKCFDIYKVVKNNKCLFELKNLKLKSIENFLGINRKDNLSGKECISLFYDYLKYGDKKNKELILKHNYDDLYYLPYILQILDIIKDKKTIYFSNFLLTNKNDLKVFIKNMNICNNVMTINCTSTKIPLNYLIIYKNNYNLKWNFFNGILNIQFQVEKGILSTMEKCFYIDLRNFENNLNIRDHTNFNLPNYILLAKIEKNFAIDNIKNIIYELIINEVFALY